MLSEQDRLTIKDELENNPAGLAYLPKDANSNTEYSNDTAQKNAALMNDLTQDGPVPTITIRQYCDIEKHAGPGASGNEAALLTNIDRLANEQTPFAAENYTGQKSSEYPNYVDAATTFLRKLVDLTGPSIDFTNPFNETTNSNGSKESENNIAILNQLAEAGAGAIADTQRDAIIAFKDLVQLVETGQESFKPGQQTGRSSRTTKRGLRRVSFRDVQASAV